MTDGLVMAVDFPSDELLLSPLLVQRDACPALFDGETSGGRGRRRASGGDWCGGGGR
jgi:hypothetical protein